jgi:hypothetical protein
VGIMCRSSGRILSVPLDSKIPSKECLLRLMSKILGYHVVAASAIGKLPQVPVSRVITNKLVCYVCMSLPLLIVVQLCMYN